MIVSGIRSSRKSSRFDARRLCGVLRDGAGPAAGSLAGANDLSNDQPRRQRESRDDFEIHQRLDADAATFLRRRYARRRRHVQKMMGRWSF